MSVCAIMLGALERMDALSEDLLGRLEVMRDRFDELVDEEHRRREQERTDWDRELCTMCTETDQQRKRGQKLLERMAEMEEAICKAEKENEDKTAELQRLQDVAEAEEEVLGALCQDVFAKTEKMEKAQMMAEEAIRLREEWLSTPCDADKFEELFGMSMRVVVGGQEFQFRFTNVDPRDPSRAFWFNIVRDDQSWIITKSDPGFPEDVLARLNTYETLPPIMLAARQYFVASLRQARR